ncbi:MAG: UDP-N-acetylmuramate--L-alanine ligase [Vicingaceae bacterium]|nr:MAG: UDP-N-acetylmuramate--L-alanine ligase [Vicingaceae bacterium]
MKPINTYHNYFFIGIGGIGMSALAQYFLNRGKNVAGYDQTMTSITERLINIGASFINTDNPDLIPFIFKENKEDTLVIYTPAIKKEENRLLQFFSEKNYEIIKRAEALSQIVNSFKLLAVAGTHGKTTTTSLLGHIFQEAGKHPLVFSGGWMKNYDSNFIDQTNPQFAICEADEYDRSFLLLQPHDSIITSVDADHLDIYGNQGMLKDSFIEFAGHTSNDGYILIHENFSELFKPLKNKKILSYGISEKATIKISNVRIDNGITNFVISLPDNTTIDIHTLLHGQHNRENITAAAALAYFHNIPPETISGAVSSFKGVKRRFEYIIKTEDFIWIDDYAHHPKEINALINTVKELYPGKTITAIFQPHLYSRTRDFLNEFAQELDKADIPVILPVYPAREKPSAGLTSEHLIKIMKNPNARLMTPEKLLVNFDKIKSDIVLTIGAGNIDLLIPEILKRYEN